MLSSKHYSTAPKWQEIFLCTLIDGIGVTAALFSQHGVSFFDEYRIDQALDAMKKINDELCGKYSHYKTGKIYEVLGVALHSETREEIVIYRALYNCIVHVVQIEITVNIAAFISMTAASCWYGICLALNGSVRFCVEYDEPWQKSDEMDSIIKI